MPTEDRPTGTEPVPASPRPGKPIYLGIDLGTTNSSAAVFDGDTVQTVRGSHGFGITPSVVRIDRQGRIQVGHRARRQLELDPDNTALEFKRLMGTGKSIAFPGAETSRRPEELAAEILRSLRADVRDQFGFEPTRAVISVPALFELPQAEATANAARLAGFEKVELIQEPIASALAAGWRADEDQGPWLVYDLGGGTFDVSLLETRDGLLRVVGHDGDNFLGGRDVDAALVDWVLAKVPALGLSRGNPADGTPLRALRRAAEETKIELSRRDASPLALDTVLHAMGESAPALEDNEVVVSRAQLEALGAPLFARSIEVCNRLLAEHGLSGSDLSRVVLVGGPTAMPGLRKIIADAIGAPVSAGLDPMSLVAHGAALYAATSQLDARPASTDSVPEATRRLWLQYPTISADLTPHVIGRLTESGTGPRPVSIELRRIDESSVGASSPTPAVSAAIDEHGTFVAMVELAPRKVNHFALAGVGGDGDEIAVHPASITIVQGLSVADPPLSRSVGVALADDRVQVYFERGAPLPGRRTFIHHAIETISAGDDEAVLRIPIVQGELDRAHLCRLVGTLEISGAILTTALHAGQAVEVTVELDRGGRLSARAYVPTMDRVFEHVERLLVPEADTATLEASLTEMRHRLAEIRVGAFRSGVPKLLDRVMSVENRLAEAEHDIDASHGGDSDAAQKARRTLLEVDAQLATVELEASWPELEDAARHALAFAAGAVGSHGTEAEQRLLAELHEAVDAARLARNAVELERQLRLVRRLANTAVHRDPDIWQWHFDNARQEVHAATDIKRATELVSQGQAAVAKGDMDGLRGIVRALWKLLPPEAHLKEVAYHSGLR